MADLISTEEAVDDYLKDVGLEIFRLPHRSDRKKEPTKRPYRKMTLEEAKRLKIGNQCIVRSGQQVVYARVVGQVKTWVRDPSRIEVPLKYGMYESFHDSSTDGKWMNLLLIEVPL